jgi:hypothetical protein
MSFSPKAHTVALAVLCVRSLCSLCLCGENLLFVAVLHRTRMVAARMSTTPSFMMRAPVPDMRHFQGSAPPPSLWTASLTPTKIAKLIFNVIKCNHFYGQPPSSALWHPSKSFKCGEMWGFPSFLQSPTCPVPTERVNERTVLS